MSGGHVGTEKLNKANFIQRSNHTNHNSLNTKKEDHDLKRKKTACKPRQKSELKLGSLNVRAGIKFKELELESLLIDHDLDILGLQEVDSHIDDKYFINITNYEVFY